MDNKFIITTIVSILLAFIGYTAKYFNDVRIAKRKERLERINRQLKELYGPLLSLTSSTKAVWYKFRENYRKETIKYFDEENPPSSEEKEIWRNWMQTVFIPINKKMYDIILEHGDLIIENEFPESFKDLCSHVESYKTVIKKWELGDFSEHLSLLNYPIELDQYVEKGYKLLKYEQNKLTK